MKEVGRAAALVLAAGAITCCMRGDDQSIDWLGDYRAGLRQAKETGKPLLVEFRCEA